MLLDAVRARSTGSALWASAIVDRIQVKESIQLNNEANVDETRFSTGTIRTDITPSKQKRFFPIVTGDKGLGLLLKDFQHLSNSSDANVSVLNVLEQRLADLKVLEYEYSIKGTLSLEIASKNTQLAAEIVRLVSKNWKILISLDVGVTVSGLCMLLLSSQYEEYVFIKFIFLIKPTVIYPWHVLWRT